MDKKWKDCSEEKLTFPLCTDCTVNNTLDNFRLNCMSTNVRSIMNKLAEFQAFFDQQVPHVIAITESWCSKSISDAELHLKGYNLFCFDRTYSIGGGVLLYVHESLPTVLCEVLMSKNIDDSIWCV